MDNYNYFVSLNLENKPRKIFLQAGFFPQKMRIMPFHKHSCSELHIVQRGTVEFTVNNKEYTVNSGSALLIPPKAYHCIKSFTEDTVNNAFQLEYECNEVACCNVPELVLLGYMNEIKLCESTKDYSKVVQFIPLILSYVLKTPSVKPEIVTDNRYLIHEFFATHYNRNIKVSDLASQLHLSDKQTQLLVKRYTNRTFKQELAACRMTMADYLIANTKMSMTDIAYAVGFKTYSGFWKMYKQHNEAKQAEEAQT